MTQQGGVPTIPGKAIEQFSEQVPDGAFSPDELVTIEVFLDGVNLGPEAIRYSPGSVALLGVARRLMATVRTLSAAPATEQPPVIFGLDDATIQAMAEQTSAMVASHVAEVVRAIREGRDPSTVVTDDPTGAKAAS